MANDITGSCEIGESVELIPDAIDDILPAGYLDEGTLPIDTTEQDIGVDPAGGMAVTGECVECPPGTVWGCCADEPEYPETPPMITQCVSVVTGIGDYYNFTDLISMNNGDNIVMLNRDAAYGLYGFRYADVDLNKIYDREADTLPSSGFGACIESFQKLDEERLVMLVYGGQYAVAPYVYKIQVINVVTNTVLSSWEIPNDGEFVAFAEPSITQYIPEENTILISFVGRKDASDAAYYVIKVNMNNGDKLVEYLWRPTDNVYGYKFGALQVGDFVYAGASSFRNPALEDNGRVNKFDKTTGVYIGLFEEGDIVAGTSGRFNFGSKIIETQEHIVIWSGYYEHVNGRPLYPFAYASYYTHLYIYDKQMNFIKRVSDETNTGGQLSDKGFSYGFSEYGNFFLIGTPELNKVGLYDKNFNFLYVINQSNPIMPSNTSGSPLLMTKDKLYFGQGNFNGVGGWDFKICDYTS